MLPSSTPGNSTQHTRPEFGLSLNQWNQAPFYLVNKELKIMPLWISQGNPVCLPPNIVVLWAFCHLLGPLLRRYRKGTLPLPLCDSACFLAALRPLGGWQSKRAFVSHQFQHYSYFYLSQKGPPWLISRHEAFGLALVSFHI